MNESLRSLIIVAASLHSSNFHHRKNRGASHPILKVHIVCDGAVSQHRDYGLQLNEDIIKEEEGLNAKALKKSLKKSQGDAIYTQQLNECLLPN